MLNSRCCPARRRLVLEFANDALELCDTAAQTRDLVGALVVARLVLDFVNTEAGLYNSDQLVGI